MSFIQRRSPRIQNPLANPPSVGNNYSQNLTGGLSFTGKYGPTLTGKVLSAGLSFTGALVKRIVYLLTGGLSFTGSLTKRTIRALAAALSFTGSLIRSYVKSFTGALSFTGNNLTPRNIVQVLNAGLSFTGAITKKTARSLYGWLSNDRTDYALYFDGTSTSKVTGVINSPATSTTSISIAVWFREPNTGSGASALSQGLIGYRFWRLHVRGGTLNMRFDEVVAHTATIAVPNDFKPHLAVGTYSYTGGTNSDMIAYLDGVASTTTSSTVLPTTQYSTNGWGIAGGSTNGAWFNGAQERALIYHRVLSGAEVTSLYQGTIPSGPYADFELQEGSGTSVADTSGNGHPNATISGNVSWGTGFVTSPVESLIRTTNKVLSAALSFLGSLLSGAVHFVSFTAALRFNRGYALLFDGQNYLQITNNSFGGLNTGTIEFFFQSTNNDGNFHKLVYAGGAIDIGLNNGQSVFAEIVGAGNVGVFATGSWADGLIHHVAVSWDGSFVRTYMDGIYKAKTAQLAAQGAASSDLYIANRAGSEFFVGTIDEFRSSNVARYTTETSFVVPGVFTNDGNTVVLLHMDEGTGATTADASGGGNTATLTGSPVPAWVMGLVQSVLSTLIKRTNRGLTAGLSFTGSTSKRTAYLLSAALSFTGSLFKRTARTLGTAALSFIGSFIAGAAHFKTLTAALSFNAGVIPAYSQTANAINAGTTSSVAVTLGSNVAAGHLIVLAVAVQSSANGTAVTSITDTLGNTYHQAVGANNADDSSADCEIWYAVSPTGGADTITVNVSSNTYVAVVAQEFSGVNQSNPLDQAVAAYGEANPTITSTSVTTTQDNEIIFGALAVNYASGPVLVSPGSGFSNLDQNRTVTTDTVAAESKLGVTAGSYAAIFTSSSTNASVFYTAAIATFKPANPVTLTKQTNRAIAAALSFAGSIFKKTTFVLTAALSFAGSITRNVARTLTAVLSFSSAFIGGALHKLTLTASLGFTGALVRIRAVNFTAALSFVGSVSRRTGKALSGGLSFTGNIKRAIKRNLTAALSFTGNVGKLIRRGLSAALGFVGSFVHGVPQRPIGDVEIITVLLSNDVVTVNLNNDVVTTELTDYVVATELQNDIVTLEIT